MKQLVALLAFVALASASVVAKGPTTRITIKDIESGKVITLADPVQLARFNVWDGPGTFAGPSGQTVEGTTGFIVDWAAGSIARPSASHKYEVQFFVRHHNQGDEKLAYTVMYERDAAGGGFVYLPGRGDAPFRVNAGSIHRGAGYEGNWFHASADWQQAMRSSLK